MRIRYYGHMGEKTGFARAAEHYCAALESVGADVERVPFTNAGVLTSRGDPYVVHADETDAVIVHTLPMDCGRALERITFIEKTGGDSLPAPPCVAYTTWEALTMNETVSDMLCDAFDEVWTPSHASVKAILGAAQLDKVFAVPHCLPSSFMDPAHQRKREDVRRNKERFRFYWIGAWNARKNPSGVIRAFAHEFDRADDVELFLHSHDTPVEALIAELAATGLSRDELPPVVLNSEYLDDDTMRDLHAGGDCFVTAARGEAWNLPCFEALCYRKHIISTGGLGSDDYLTETDSYMVAAWNTPAWNTLSRTVAANGEIGAHIVTAQGLTSRDLWREPDLRVMATYMRDAFKRGIGTEARIDYSLAERYSYAPVAQMILNRLEALR